MLQVVIANNLCWCKSVKLADPFFLMSLLAALFESNRYSPARKERQGMIKEWVRTHCEMESDTIIRVNQLQCRDAACPGTETIITLMEYRRTRRFKFPKAMNQVSEFDLTEAIRSGAVTVKIYPPPAQ
jgi:hypothetical protein